MNAAQNQKQIDDAADADSRAEKIEQELREELLDGGGMNNEKQSPTLLVIHPGKEGGDAVYSIVVAETGEALASHMCSHSGFAYSDLYGRRENRKAEWAERFGEVEVKFLEETDIDIDELVARNHHWAKKEADHA
jgi:hypothetical protein